MKKISYLAAALCCLSAAVLADTAAEVQMTIEKNNAYTKANMQSPADPTSAKGSMEFWSSGGLMQSVPASSPVQKFERFGLTPKHIHVITLEEGKSAVAMYYSEGAYQPEGMALTSNYLTRVTEVYVKESGKWKVRVAHFSPVSGGEGTKQTSLD
ncbi:nuclear transport factor 2 family protein [Lacimicrobium alkaliphilum]|uniref:SnoaL-like domain-containing protein n=1 Tax=Lacimicrobium alkaliphilum TaxID=1526571 RepID=A0A0U3AK85_9ALTE|nr:nuclear transport factor 2 family protein [Lacimicrobium alkaliphilum]ALS98386.1 hypothetical protein AT746_09035 [Lacimicrobium alkaliphilum]